MFFSFTRFSFLIFHLTTSFSIFIISYLFLALSLHLSFQSVLNFFFSIIILSHSLVFISNIFLLVLSLQSVASLCLSLSLFFFFLLLNHSFPQLSSSLSLSLSLSFLIYLCRLILCSPISLYFSLSISIILPRQAAKQGTHTPILEPQRHVF